MSSTTNYICQVCKRNDCVAITSGLLCPKYTPETHFEYLKTVQLWTEKAKREQLYNLDHTIAKFVLPLLKDFKNTFGRNGTPCIKLNENDTEEITNEQWLEILDDMIFGFDNVVNGPRFTGEGWTEEIGERAQRGLELFGKFFTRLWY